VDSILAGLAKTAQNVSCHACNYLHVQVVMCASVLTLI